MRDFHPLWANLVRDLTALMRKYVHIVRKAPVTSTFISHQSSVIGHVNEKELNTIIHYLFLLDLLHRRSSVISHQSRVTDPIVHVTVKNWNSINLAHVNDRVSHFYVGESIFFLSEILPNARVIVPSKHGKHGRNQDCNNKWGSKIPLSLGPQGERLPGRRPKIPGVGENNQRLEYSKC